MLNANCLRFFVGLSLTAALILPSYIYFFLSPHFRQLMVDNTEKEAVRVCNHLISRYVHGGAGLSSQTIRQRLQRSEARIKEDFQIKAFKLFSDSGKILYSSQATDVGTVNSHRYFKDIVSRGATYSKLVKAGDKTMEGAVVPVSVVHTYVPIMEGDTFAGAFEIYYDITPVKARFDAFMTKVYSVIGVIVAVMLLLISLSFCKARRVIKQKRLLDEERDKNFQTEVFFNKLFQLSLVKASLAEILEIFLYHLISFPGIALEAKAAVFLTQKHSKPLKLVAQCGLYPDLFSSCTRDLFGPCGCKHKTEQRDCFLVHIFEEENPPSPDDEPAASRHYCVPIHSSQGPLLGVFVIYPKDGATRTAKAKKILLAAANLLAGIIERKQLEEKLRNISITDELTGLFNRRGFRTLAQQELDRAERQNETMAVFYIDLDGLKLINDRHGHNAGDQAIKDTAEILKETFRAADVIARIGGDEFAVFGSFSPQTRSDSVLRWRLSERIRTFNDRKKRPYAISCSVGISYIIPGGPETLDTTLCQADSAMYEEKRKKNFSPPPLCAVG